MNRVQILRVSFQSVFVINCIFLYGYLITNTPEQAKFILTRTSSKVENVCYLPLRKTPKVEDLLSMRAPTFDNRFKNPCFYEDCSGLENGTRQFRCLPYFHLLGVDKCGSTDLFLRLLEHPHVKGNNGSLQKETMWWSWKRYGLWLSKYRLPKQPFRDYLDYFRETAMVISNTTTTDPESIHYRSSVVTGDGTPMDFWDFSGWKDIEQNKGLDYPKVLTPHLLKHVNPNAKLIIILRNPTQRVYSDYMFLKLGTRTSKGFHDEVLFSQMFLKSCLENNRTLESCLYDRKHTSQFKARINVGLYSVFLKEWLKVFNRDQLLVLRTEDYAKNIKGTLKTVFRFLDLEELRDEELNRIAQLDRAHTTVMKSKQGPMHKRTKKVLDKFYKPFNEELADILNDTRFLWDT